MIEDRFWNSCFCLAINRVVYDLDAGPAHGHGVPHVGEPVGGIFGIFVGSEADQGEDQSKDQRGPKLLVLQQLHARRMYHGEGDGGGKGAMTLRL